MSELGKLMAELTLRNMGASSRDLKRVLGKGISETEEREFAWLWKKAQDGIKSGSISKLDAAFAKLQTWEKAHPEAFAYLFGKERDKVAEAQIALGDD